MDDDIKLCLSPVTIVASFECWSQRCNNELCFPCLSTVRSKEEVIFCSPRQATLRNPGYSPLLFISSDTAFSFINGQELYFLWQFISYTWYFALLWTHKKIFLWLLSDLQKWCTKCLCFAVWTHFCCTVWLCKFINQRRMNSIITVLAKRVPDDEWFVFVMRWLR